MSPRRWAGGPTPVGPSDGGLAGERTSLAWIRVGLALVAVPAGLAGYAFDRSLGLTLVASSLAAVVGLGLLVLALRRPRTAPDMVARAAVVIDGARVVLATATVVLISVASLAIVLQT
jgi:uncharacterized membrane protein YidH (DUF202 family)